MQGVVFLLAALSAWALFSSQSDRPWQFNATEQRSAPIGVALLHVTASIGVPSFSGHPTNGQTCTDATRAALPAAQRLAQMRASAFADELGVRVVRLYARDAPKQNPAQFAPAGFEMGDCGLPKYGRAPVTASIGESFAIRAKPIRVRPAQPALASPTASPQPYPTIRPEIVPAILAGERVINVQANGTARMRADAVQLRLTIEPPQPTIADAPKNIGPRSDADIATLLAVIRQAFPDAQTHTTYETVHYAAGNRPTGIVQIDRYRADVTALIPKPDRAGFISIGHAITDRAGQAGLTVQAMTLPLLNSCEDIEDAAREDAIAKATEEAMRRAAGANTVRLIFADQQPLWTSSICGPIIDESFAYGGPGFLDPQLSAVVAVSLEFLADK
jgi:hypothetical protein